MRLNDHLYFWFHYATKQPLRKITSLTQSEQDRLELYFRPQPAANLTESIEANSLSKLKSSFYIYDWYRIINRDDTRRCKVGFGDVKHIFSEPTFTKSRPISTNNHNNVLLPFDTSRHFKFYIDKLALESKKDTAIWRGAAYQPHRKLFLTQASQLPGCDCQDTGRNSEQNFFRKSRAFLKPTDQLNHKFIFAIEGNELASNLKWIMASNSVAVMPKPSFEGWFAESMLIANQHFIEVKSDFSNISEVLEYFLTHPKECKEISDESTNYTASFQNMDRQYALARMVTEEYFSKFK